MSAPRRSEPAAEQRAAVLVKACLNGARHRYEHPSLPIAPSDLALDARRAVDAGAAALHVHPRRQDGSETLDPGDCATTIRAIRAACPGIPVGLSTAIWIEGDPARRLACVSAWTVLPDFVSVNVSEAGTIELCAALVSRQIGIEAGVWTAADARALAETGLAGRCLRVLLEPQENDPQAGLATAAAIDAALDRHAVGLPRLLHGQGGAAWAVLDAALDRGHDIRIGFEDTLVRPDGSRAEHNGDLVAAAVAAVRRRGYRPQPAPSP